MANVSHQHPEKEQLVAFGLGKLGEDEAEQIAQHLDSCQDCSETILNLQDDTFVALVRNSPAPEPVQDVDLASVSDEKVLPQATVDIGSGAPGRTSRQVELPPELREHPRYEIVGLIGKGGMGDVYRARHRMMERTVAVKIINCELVRKPEAVDRFHREVKTAAQLSHPNIVTSHDAEQAGDVHFLVMEYVDGVDLSQTVKERGALSITEACDYIRQAAIGLQHAHQQGMVHRDIKPHNLMVTADGTVKILDFGLASLAPAALPDADMVEARGDLTAAGAIMGSPDFISPEQADDARQADIRSDIYSLGTTLYFLLSGRPPFTDGSVMHKLKSHAVAEPEPLESLRDDIPADLAVVVSRMMAKDPDERFQTPAEVAEALQTFSPASQPAKEQSARPQIQPHRHRSRSSKLTAVATVFVAAIAAAAVFYIQSGNTTLRFEINDPDVSVSFAGESISVDTPDNKTFRVKPATEQKFVVCQNGTEVETNSLTLRRGQKIVLKIDVVEGQIKIASNVRDVQLGQMPHKGDSKVLAESESLKEAFLNAIVDLVFANPQLDPQENQGKGDFFERLRQRDRDGDGKLSQIEVPQTITMSKSFQRIDSNSDGFIDTKELEKTRGQLKAETEGFITRRRKYYPEFLMVTAKIEKMLQDGTPVPNANMRIANAEKAIDELEVSIGEPTKELFKLWLPRRKAGTLTPVLTELLADLMRSEVIDHIAYKVGSPTHGWRGMNFTPIISLEKTLELYKLDYGRYPSTEEGMKALLENPADDNQAKSWGGPGPYDEQTPRYLIELPTDPWGNPFGYELPATRGGDATKPRIWSWGPDGKHNTKDDIRNWEPEADNGGEVKPREPQPTDSEFSPEIAAMLADAGVSEAEFRNTLYTTLSQAASMPTGQLLDAMIDPAPGWIEDEPDSEPLSFVLLKLNFLEAAKKNPAVLTDFRFITDGIPEPSELVEAVSSKAMASKKEHGRVSMIQPEYIKRAPLELEGKTLRGSVEFEAPNFYAGKANFVIRLDGPRKMQVVEFELPNYGIVVARDEQGVWRRRQVAKPKEPKEDASTKRKKTTNIAEEAKNVVAPYSWTTVNHYTPELLQEMEERDAKPSQVVIGEACSNEDFAQVCTWPWIREMRIKSQQLTDLSPLAKLTELISLEMFMMEQTEKQRLDIEALSALKKLVKIEFYASRVTNTDALAGLSELKDLSIYMSDFESLDFLQHTPAIEKLSLFGHGHTFQDYKPVLHLKHLKELDITANTQAVDQKLKDLEGLTTLEKFSMPQCWKVTTLDFLRNCKGLKELEAGAARGLRDASVLAGFTQLEKLNLASVPLEDIAFLKGKSKLSELDLSRTKVRDISVLAETPELLWLDLEDTDVTDLSPLLQLDALPQVELPQGVSEEQFAALKARAFPPGEMKRVAPTGLTLVACDTDQNVLDTLVVPDDKESMEVGLALPEGLAEIRVFVVGQRERIHKAPAQARPDVAEYYDELFQSNTENYFAYRRKDGNSSWSGIMKIKEGEMKGFSGFRMDGVKPLKLTAELREQIHEDIIADERTPIFIVSEE